MTPKLCKYRDLPRHLQFNPYVLTGYRPLLTASDCVKSIFHLHNESFNIISHVLCLLVFSSFGIYLYGPVWSAGPWSSTHTLVIIDCIASIVPFLFSVIYHIFMCHQGGPKVYTALLKMDVAGVWFVTTFGEVPIIYSSLYCSPWLNAGYMSWYLMLSLIALWFFLSAESKRGRILALAIQYVFRIALLALRISPLGIGFTESLWCYITMECLAVPGALINALHIPERWLPGKVDYLFNGHNLMHIVSILLVTLGRKGFLSDMQWISQSSVCPV